MNFPGLGLMHRTQGLPSPSSTCAARTVCPSASRQRPPTPAHRGRGLPIKATDEGCTAPKRPVRAGSSCALERCLICPCACREQGHARVWHHQHHCFFSRSRNCCCPQNGWCQGRQVLHESALFVPDIRQKKSRKHSRGYGCRPALPECFRLCTRD